MNFLYSCPFSFCFQSVEGDVLWLLCKAIAKLALSVSSMKELTPVQLTSKCSIHLTSSNRTLNQ